LYYPATIRTSAFLLALTRPPPSTLFPYTTLFRSTLRLRSGPSAALRAFGCAPFGCAQGRRQSLRPPLLNIGFLEGEAEGFLDSPDRKSTRLNSSHVAISYAVFCLKKKTEWAFMLS